METIDRFCTALVLNAAWQVPLIALAAAIAARPRVAAALRCRVWLGAALLASALPLATAARLVLPSSDSAVTAATPAVSVAPSTRIAARVRPMSIAVPQAVSIALPHPIGHWAVTLLLAVALHRLFVTARAAANVGRIRRATVAAPPPVAVEARRVAQQLGLHALPVRLSTSVRVPITIGVFSPIVVLPESLALSAALPVLRFVLAHEAAHVRRRDLAWQMLVTIASLPIAFHPVTWLLSKALDASREQACDDAVAVDTRQRRSYARALVAVASRALGSPSPRLGLAATDPATLDRRIARLLRPSPVRTPTHAAAAIVLMALAFVAASAFAVTPEATATTLAIGSEPSETERAALGLAPQDGAYRYDTAGRRDPFRNPRVVDDPPVGIGLARYAIEDVALRGIVTTPQGPVALFVGPDTRTYFVRVGQRFRNGVATAIESQAVLLREDLDLSDALTTVKTRDLRWPLHGERMPAN